MSAVAQAYHSDLAKMDGSDERRTTRAFGDRGSTHQHTPWAASTNPHPFWDKNSLGTMQRIGGYVLLQEIP